MQAVVFALVATTFLTMYVTQPVLPVLTAEFGVTPGVASLTVSAVVLGIALANLPFGVLADRVPIGPIVLCGGAVVAAASVTCALTPHIGVLISPLRWLPREPPHTRADHDPAGFLALLAREELLRMFAVGFFAFFVFSSMFNYIPFYLSGAPLHASVRVITLLYLAYLVGIAAGPFSGTLTRRLGTGVTLIAGSALFGLSLALTLVPSLPVIAVSLAGICGGFFVIHSAAVGSLNGRLTGSRGRANSLYVLLYYLGGAAGISASGATYARWGWRGTVALAAVALLVPLSV